MTDELVERMARAIEKSLAWDVEGDVRANDLTREEQRNLATAALAALRETHHLIPKDQEPVTAKPSLHRYTPDPEYPWFCGECGYPEHETLKHPPRDPGEAP